MKKQAEEAKKAAAELTARLEALEVEAKAKKEVIFFFCLSFDYGQRSEQSKVPFVLRNAAGVVIVLFCKRSDWEHLSGVGCMALFAAVDLACGLRQLRSRPMHKPRRRLKR